MRASARGRDFAMPKFNRRFPSRHRILTNRAAAFAGACALTTCASGQLVNEPFDYGNATGTNLANLTDSPTFAGYTNPSNGLTWFDTGTNVAVDGTSTPFPITEVTIGANSLGRPSGLAPASGGSAIYDVYANTGTTLINSRTPRMQIAPGNFTSGTVYYSVSWKITDLTDLTSGGAFFMSFNNSTGTQGTGPTVVGARLRARINGDGFSIGVQSQGGTTDDNTVYHIGDEIFTVLSYTFNDGAANDASIIWINPDSSTYGAAAAPAGSLSASGGADMAQVASLILRQTNNIVPKGIVVDEIKIDTSWAQVTAPAGTTWAGTSGASWSSDGNWAPGTHPNGASQFVNFTDNAGGNVVVDSPQTVGCLTIKSTGGYTLSGSALTFDSGAGAELGATAINVLANMDPSQAGVVLPGSHEISAPLVLNNSLSNNISVAQSLTLSGNISGSGGVIKNGGGTLTLTGNNSYTGGLRVGNGTVAISTATAPGSGSITFGGGTLRTNANLTVGNDVAMTSNGTIDTATNTATFSGAISGGTLDLNKVGDGTLLLTGTNNTYRNTLVRDGTLRIASPSNLGAGSNLSLASGALRTDAAMSLSKNLIITTVGTFDTNGANSSVTGNITGTGTFRKEGAGVLTTNAIKSAGLNVNTGTVAVASGRDSAKTSVLTGILAVNNAGGAALDLGDNDLAWNYTGTPSGTPDPTKLASVQSLLAAGYAGGAWNGLGINSSVAATIAGDGSNNHKTALGFAEASAAGLGNFAGAATDGDFIAIRYTYAGDANLDGQVTTGDFDAIATNFNATGKSWVNGDFNFDGVVNALDFNAVASNFGATTISSAPLGTLVPEPATIALIAVAGSLLPRRRLNSRRRNA
jgi:autotransporter-associated beta strand protein